MSEHRERPDLRRTASDVLARICADTRAAVAQAKTQTEP